MKANEAKHEVQVVEWKDRVRECRSSGLKVKEWCEEQGINPSTYYRWEREVLGREKGVELNCPAGHEPVSCKYNEKNGQITAAMPNNCCANCPHRDECKAKVNEKRIKVPSVLVARWSHGQNGQEDFLRKKERRTQMACSKLPGF